MRRALVGIGLAGLGLLMVGCGTPAQGTAQYIAACNATMDLDGGMTVGNSGSPNASNDLQILQQDGYSDLVSDYNAWAEAVTPPEQSLTSNQFGTDMDNDFDATILSGSFTGSCS